MLGLWGLGLRVRISSKTDLSSHLEFMTEFLKPIIHGKQVGRIATITVAFVNMIVGVMASVISVELLRKL